MKLQRLTALLLAAVFLFVLAACQPAERETEQSPETELSQSALPPETEEDESGPEAAPPEEETEDPWADTIAYVPIDDRPDNVQRVVWLAESAGYRVVIPDQDLFSTRLDGQPPNENGTQYGDRAALLEWVCQADADGCDLFLLSLDQLLSGGLVNSRAMSQPQDLVFSDGTVLSESEAVDTYLLPLADDPENRVYFFDSLMRLASTVGYAGYDLAHYNALRAYGNVARPTLEEADLTLEAVIASYPWGPDGTTPAGELVGDAAQRSLLTAEVTADYCAARERKMRLLDQVLQATAGEERFYFLVGVDDSSGQRNVQTNEMAYLQRVLGERGLVINGVDDLGMMMVARIAIDDAGLSISAYVEYIGGMEQAPTTVYDHQVLSDTIVSHIEALDGVRTEDPAQADLQVIVLTRPAEPARTEEYCQTLVQRLKENLSQGIPTIYIDTSSGCYPELETMLLEQIPLGSLLGFAGMFDLVIIAGAGIGQGFARYACLAADPEAASGSATAFLRSLTVGLVLGGPYSAAAKPQLDSYVSGTLGLSIHNILGTAEQMRLVQEKLEQTLLPACQDLCDNLSNSPVLVGTEGETAGPFSVRVESPFLPWNRTFEAGFTVCVE